MGELAAAGAGLCQQLRDRRLQQALGEEERGLERDARDGARAARRGRAGAGDGSPSVLSSRNQAGARWNTAASSSRSSAEGMRLPLSIMLR